MKSFLVKGKKPILKWGGLPDGVFFKGEAPEGYKVAVNPSPGMIVIDVDMHGNVDGFSNIPTRLIQELNATFRYSTKGGGAHYWFWYTGDKDLPNTYSKLGIDLRTHKGYAIWYSEKDIKSSIEKFSKSSPTLNKWLEDLFYFKTLKSDVKKK